MPMSVARKPMMPPAAARPPVPGRSDATRQSARPKISFSPTSMVSVAKTSRSASLEMVAKTSEAAMAPAGTVNR